MHCDHAHTYLINCLRDKVSYIVTDNATNIGKAAAFLFKNVIQLASRNLNGEVYLTSCVIDLLCGYHWMVHLDLSSDQKEAFKCKINGKVNLNTVFRIQ